MVICGDCKYSVFEYEEFDVFLIDCKREKQLTNEEYCGFINQCLEECKQYKPWKK